MSQSKHFLRDHFLISMPHMDSDDFAKTIIYLCDHSDYGAMGLVINKPIGMKLGQMLNHLELDSGQKALDTSIFAGGPVQDDRGFVLHRPYRNDPWVQTYKITEEIQLTTSLDILESITHHDDFQGMIALGYAGWGPGQLEKEISDNVWLSCPANSDILFDMPVDERMQAAAGLLGIKLNQLTAHSGHA
jgi:putative transcriptional regulator